MPHRPSGEIGRRRGLKIPRRKACRFESGLGHQPAIVPSAADTATVCSLTPPVSDNGTPHSWGDQGLNQAHWRLALFVLLLIVGALMPAGLKNGIHAAIGVDLPLPSLAHFLLFALIAASPVYGEGRAAQVRTLAFVIALALATEAAQHWVPGRHPLWRDVGIDLGGALLGRLVWLAWFRPRSLPGSCPP